MANQLPNPPLQTPVDTNGKAISTPWQRWVSQLSSFLRFPSLLAGTNAYTTETDGVNLNGVNVAGSVMISDMGAAAGVQLLLHKHSTTVEPIILGTRSNTDTQDHANVASGMPLLTIEGSGTAGTSYKVFGAISFYTDTAGTISNTSAPGAIRFNVTPDGSTTPATVLSLKNDKSATFAGKIKTV